MSITNDLQTDSHLSVEELLKIPIFEESLVSTTNLSTIPGADSLNGIISYVVSPPFSNRCLLVTATADEGNGSH